MTGCGRAPRPWKPGISTCGSSPGMTMFVLKAGNPRSTTSAPSLTTSSYEASLLGVRHLPGARARGAAVRPVDVDVVARRPAEELVHGNAECLPLEVEQRVLDSADRLLDHRAGALPGCAEEIPDDPLDRAWVAADDLRGQILDDAREPARRAVRVRDLGPADRRRRPPWPSGRSTDASRRRSRASRSARPSFRSRIRR